MRHLAALLLASSLCYSALVLAWDGSESGKIVQADVTSAGNYSFRLVLEGSPALCGNANTWEPSSHPACNASYFAIDATLPEKLIDRMLARAMTALAGGAALNIGYDNAGNCAHGFIRVYRIG